MNAVDAVAALPRAGEKPTVDAVIEQVEANGASLTELRLGPLLAFDPKAETFTGDQAAEANRLLRPTMRKEFAIPDQV